MKEKKRQQRAPTSFETEVYEATRRIPRGRVTTYGSLAAEIGCGSSQAVGQALSRNPFAPEVPCHRVIRSDLTIGGFAGTPEGPEVERKLGMLRKEGVPFSRGKLVDEERLFRF